MSKYRKIDVRIWNDQKFASLSDGGKLAFLFLLTHPHLTALGAMRGTQPGLAAELGWTTEAFREAFTEAFLKALVKHDERASFIWLPNFLKYNRPESPNVVKSWAVSLDLIPECPLKYQLMQDVKGFAEGLGKAFAEALPEAFRKAMPNQEQEQEQEQDKQEAVVPTKPKAAKPKFKSYLSWITAEDLSDVSKVLDWHSRVVKVGNSPFQDSDGSRINTLAAASLARDAKNPMAWFTSCIQEKFKFVTQAAEDAASKSLKDWRRQQGGVADLFAKLTQATTPAATPDVDDESFDDLEGDE